MLSELLRQAWGSIDWVFRFCCQLNLLQQRTKHALRFYNLCCQSLVVLRIHETQVTSEKQVIFGFARRSKRNLNEFSKLKLRSAAPFRKVCSNRSSCAAKLACQAEYFGSREAFRNPVNLQREFVSFIPCLEISEILHGLPHFRFS